MTTQPPPTDRLKQMQDRGRPDPSWQDRRLVGACLDGDERAWGALVDKYSQLVFAIASRSGAPQNETTDLFQAIWLDAFNDLPKLKKRNSFKPWLTSLARHKSFHWRHKHYRREAHEVASLGSEEFDLQAAEEPELIEQLARDQLVRDAIHTLSERCREMIRLLFFSFPAKPYKEVAEQLGLATGSIGFIRGRCLQRLKKTLERQGL